MLNKYFESITDDGSVQITDDTKMYRLKSVERLSGYFAYQGDFTFNDTDAGNGTHTGYFYKIADDDNGSDLCFIRNPFEKYVGLWTAYTAIRYTEPNKPYTTHWPNELRGWWACVHNCTKEEADNMLVYRYTTDVTKTDNHIGLELFNANGEKIFASDDKLLKIINFTQLIHTEDKNVGWTNNWTMQQPQYNFQNDFAVWMTQLSHGGAPTNKPAGYAKSSHFWLNNRNVKIAWLTQWWNEHSNVKDKYWYWSTITQDMSPCTQFIIADVSNV